MRCPRCGGEVMLGQKFCISCGEALKQEETQNQNSGYAQISGKNNMVLTIFSTLCAIIYGVRTIGKMRYIIRGLPYWAEYGISIKFVLAALEATLGVWICLMLICIAVKGVSKNHNRFLYGLCGGGVALIAEQIFQIIYDTSLRPKRYVYSRGILKSTGSVYSTEFVVSFQGFIITVIGILITVIGVYIISRWVTGKTSFMGTGSEQLAEPKYIKSNQMDSHTSVSFPLKTDRSLLMYILLSIITCGIYSLYFIYTLSRDINVVCDGDGKNTAGLIKLLLLSLVTCGIYNLFWYYSLGERIAANGSRYDIDVRENGTTILLWNLFGVFLFGIGPLVAMNMIIKNMNMLCGAYNRQHNI